MVSLKDAVRTKTKFAPTLLEERGEDSVVHDRTRGKIPRSKQRPLKDSHSSLRHPPLPLTDVEKIVDSFDLEKFQWIVASTHEDGISVPENGFLFEYFVYEMRVRWFTRSTPYVNGLPVYEHSETEGDNVFLTVSAVRDRYLQILAISNLIGQMYRFTPGKRTIRGGEGDSSLLVDISPGILKILRTHHQYRQLCERWELRGYVLELVSVSMTSVEVMLRHQTDRERLECLDRQNAKKLEKTRSRSFVKDTWKLLRDIITSVIPLLGK